MQQNQKLFRATCLAMLCLLAGLGAKCEAEMSEYAIEIKSGRDGARRVNPSYVFRSGDRFRFVFRSDFDAFVYLFSRGTGEGAYSRLFPHSGMQASNVVRPDFNVLVPDAGNWFAFDEQDGVEHVVIVVANRPLRELDEVGTEIGMDRLDYTLSQLSRMRGYSGSRSQSSGEGWTKLTLLGRGGSAAVRVSRLALTHHRY